MARAKHSTKERIVRQRIADCVKQLKKIEIGSLSLKVDGDSFNFGPDSESPIEIRVENDQFFPA